ncbi:MAG: hypothetical protein N3A61_00005 [Ignavibacteria bacterium]|nr:hypothetical protein [Ignavibacteria bacterium]
MHIFDAVEKKIIETIQDQDLISISNPSWSNDGERVVFSSIDKKGFSDIFIYDTRTQKIGRLTNDYYDDRQPVFSPNDKYVIFSSDRTCGSELGNYNLFEISLSDLKIRYVTYSKFNSTNPRFSKDGSRLIFMNNYDNVSNIWSVDVVTDKNGYSYSNKMKRITKFTTSSFDPNLTLSNSILFCALEKFSFQIYEFKDYSQVSDSLNETVQFDLDLYQENWRAERIYAEKIKSNLRYKGDYTLDFAQSQIATNPVYGTTGGGILSVSDVLSDDQYLFFIYNNAQSSSDFLKSFNVAVSRLFLGKKTNYSFGIFHFSGRRYDIRDSDEYFFERSYGGFFGLSYPLSNFQRFEASIGLANSDKEIFGIKNRKAVLLTNSISYIYDNSIWISTGPLDGHRFLFLLGQTNDIKFSNVNYFTIMLDYRHYVRIDLRTTLALRAQLFYNQGTEARRYFMGGNWDLRGWNRWSIRGEKLWLSSVELRFPLINQILISFPFVKLNFYDLRSAIFADFGSAWDTKYEATLGSLGFGFRINLFGVVVLRYDMGKKLENNLKKIQKGLFYQFFFGWDF